METTPDPWQGRINRCVEASRKWGARTTAEDGDPLPGSRVAREDEFNRTMPFSTVAWSSISIAVDHLGLADDAMSREGGGRLRPFAFYTLCRGALVAASQALWVLSGSRDVRLRRLRFVELAELEGQRSLLRDYVNDKTLSADVSVDFAHSLKDKLKKVDDRFKEVKRSLKPERPYEASNTTMLREAAALVNGSREDDPWLTRAYMTEWRLASGAAHARIWSSDLRPNETLPLIGQGKRLRVSTATLESYGTSLAAATMATSEAFRLWDKHAGSIREGD